MEIRVDGRVALITGAARGQGRSHAVALAEAGADVIAVDICKDLSSPSYPLATSDDLRETVAMVEALGRRIVSYTADVRDAVALSEAVTDGVARLGGIDFVIANAGISALQPDESPNSWDEVVGVNLTGAFNTVQAAVPSMIERGAGGCVVLIGSTAAMTSGFGATPSALAYSASKHGLIGLMRSYAASLGQYSIRANAVHPTVVDTVMAQSQGLRDYVDQVRASPIASSGAHALPIPRLECIDVSNAVLFLVSEAGRSITGINFPVDLGYSN